MNYEAASLLIRGGRIVDPSQGIDQVGDLLVADGRIVQIHGHIKPTPSLSVILSKAKNLDATGLIVCPGFVDLHCHLREPGFEDKETIATGTKAAAAGGFTTVCCMPNTNPPLDSPSSMARVKAIVSSDSLITVFPVGCISKGRKGKNLTDMDGLAKTGAVAFSDDGDPVANSQLMRLALEYSRDLGLMVTDHCEDKSLSDNGIMNEGRISARLGLKGIPSAAEDVMVARDLILARLTGGRLHIAHASTRGSVELIRRAKQEGVSVTSEVTPHHLTLTEERVTGRSTKKAFDTNSKVNPPLRTREDVEALIKGLNDGVIDAIATDHAPHTPADKNCDPQSAAFGISGFETALGCLMSLVHQGKISLTRLISKLTCEPAKVIGRSDQLGTLRAGAPSNITILDLDREWVVDSSNFASKGRNTPFDGYVFRGKVVATIGSGTIVYMDNLLRSRSPAIACHSESTPCHSESTPCHSKPTPCHSERSEESRG
jgi:dihydroorotase